MKLHSNLDDRLIDSLKKRLTYLENTSNSGLSPAVAISMLSLHPSCLLKGFTVDLYRGEQYRISNHRGDFVYGCETASETSEKLASLYKAN